MQHLQLHTPVEYAHVCRHHCNAQPLTPPSSKWFIATSVSIAPLIACIVFCLDLTHLCSGTNTLLGLLRVAAVAACPGSPLARCQAPQSYKSCAALTQGQPHRTAAAVNSSGGHGTCRTCCQEHACPHCDQQHPSSPKRHALGLGPPAVRLNRQQPSQVVW